MKIHCVGLVAEGDTVQKLLAKSSCTIFQVTCSDENVSVLWDVAKPNPVLTLEDLARLRQGKTSSRPRLGQFLGNTFRANAPSRKARSP